MRNRVITKQSIINGLYYCALTLYIVYSALSSSMIGQNDKYLDAYGVVMIACVTLCGLKFIFAHSYEWKSLFISVISVVVILGVYFAIRMVIPVVLTMLIIGAKGCSAKKISKIYLACVCLVVGISMVCSQLGIVKDRIFYRTGDDIPRHSMGMTYVTIWAGMMFFIMAVYFYLRKEKIRKIELLIWGLISIGVYIASGTRTEIILSLCLILCVTFYKRLNNKKMFIIFLKYSLPLSAMFALVIEALYFFDSRTFGFLNVFFTDRLRYAAMGISQYGLSLFGKAIKMQGYGTVKFDYDFGYFFIDSFYINYLLQYGIVIMLVFLVTYSCVGIKLFRRNEIWTLLFLAFANIHGIVISSIVTPHICPFYLIALANLSENKNVNSQLLKEKDV